MEWFERNDSVRAADARAGAAAATTCHSDQGRAPAARAPSAAHDYITRSEAYDDPERDAAVYTESGHMPSWAEDEAREYWDAADLYERANGRLYVSADFALPRGLDRDDQIALARSFAQELTDERAAPLHPGDPCRP